MKRIWKRAAALFLCAAMLLTAIPMQALAALVDLAPSQREALLEGLRESCGDEEAAQEAFAFLLENGIVDEDGNVQEWDIQYQGEAVTLEEARGMIASGAYLDQSVTVDGTEISLAELKTMLEIHDEIQRLRETYFTQYQLSPQQEESFQSLYRQLASQGVSFLAESPLADDTPTLSFSGVKLELDEAGDDALNPTCSLNYTMERDNDHTTWNATDHGAVTFTLSIEGPISATIEVSYGSFFVPGANKVFTFQGDPDGGLTAKQKMDLFEYMCNRGTPFSAHISNVKGNKNEVLLVDSAGRPVESLTVPVQFSFSGSWNGTVGGDVLTQSYTSNDSFELSSNEGSPALTWDSGSDLYRGARLGAYDKLSITFPYPPSSGYNLALSEPSLVYLYLSSSISPTFNTREFRGDIAFKREGSDFVREDASQAFVNNWSSTVSGATYQSSPDKLYVAGAWVTTNGKYETKTGTITWKDTKTAALKSVTAPKRTFYPGEKVSIAVEFSEPVVGSPTLLVNGSAANVACVNSGGTILLFHYTVPEDPPQTLTVSGISGITELCGREVTLGQDKTYELEGTTCTYRKTDALDMEGYTAEVAASSEPGFSTLKVTIPVKQGPASQWLASETQQVTDESGSTRYRVKSMHGEITTPAGDTVTDAGAAAEARSMDLYAQKDSSGAITALTGELELPLNLTGEDLPVHVGIYLDRAVGSAENQVLIWESQRELVSPSVKPLKGESLKVGQVEGFPSEGTVIFMDKWEEYQGQLRLLPGTVPNTDATWMDTSLVTEAGENGHPADPAAHFMWVSSNPQVAAIDKAGNITPTGNVPAGQAKVEFRLMALNAGYNGQGCVEDEANGFLSQPVALTFGRGNTPFLNGGGDLTISQGSEAVVRWMSNLTEKNHDNGIPQTDFTVTVYPYSGEEDGTPPTGEPVAQQTVTSTMEKIVGSAAFQGLDVISTGEKASYRYEVSALCGGVTYAAYGTISVTARPVGARLERPQSLQVPSSGGSHRVAWSLEHFDTTNGADVQVQVTHNETGEVVAHEEKTLSGTDSPAGTLDFSFKSMETGKLRESYTVELAAKNESQAQNDWSRDSYILTVYNAEALQILVDGQKVDSVTLSNKDRVAGKNQEAILALDRQIDLKTPVSINYDAYPWTQLEDQIRWKVESTDGEGDTAILNNQQGGVWSDLRAFDYDSYSPDTELLLTGHADGTAVVTATHKWLEGMEDTLDVTVDTLRDELYLFQFYPKGQTTLQYTTVENGKTVEKTAASTAEGKAAIYEPNGITGDVYVTSGSAKGGDLYVGTLRKDALASSEQFSGAGSLYPLNTLELRRLANVPLFLVRPNGVPYANREITLWGGVYRNGEYVENTTIQVNGTNESLSSEEGVALTTDGAGKLTLQFDPTQFTTATQTHPVTASDELEFVLEIHAPGFYPQFVTVNGTMNEDESIQAGERQVDLTEVPEGQADKPFIASQELYFNHQGTGASIDLKTAAGGVGPSADYPKAMIETQVFWWGAGETAAGSQGGQKVTLADENGVAPAFQTQELMTYPFSQMPVTVHRLPMDRSNMAAWGFPEDAVSSRNVTLSYVDGQGVTIKQEQLPFKVTDATSLEKASVGIEEDAGELINSILDIQLSTGNLGEDGMTSSGLESIGVDDVSVSGVTMKIAPTSNPLVFRAVLALGMDNMTTKATGINIQTVEPSDEAALGLMPGYSDLKHMSSIQEYKDYAKENKGKIDQLLGTTNKVSDGSVSYQLKAWYELELTNHGLKGWSLKLLGGGGAAGLGYGYDWNFNTMVGPVPFTVSLGLGAASSLSVSFASDQETRALDSLTKLEVMAYLRAFAGVGFDYAILAAKIGLFGQVSADMELLFLNRENGEDMTGDHFQFDGTIGVEAVFKFLFINYEKVLWSEDWKAVGETGQSQYDDIQEYWDYAVNGWGSRYPAAGSVNTLAVMPTAQGSVAILSQDQPASLESREYLELFPRSWGGASTASRRSLAAGGDTAAVKNIYPYASPQSTDDGAITVFLDDNPADKAAGEVTVSDTCASYAAGTDFTERTVIDTTIMKGGAGDSQLKLDGTGSFAVAGWTRLDKESVPTKEPGAKLTLDDQALMLNGSEIVAAVYSGGQWAAEQITDNATPDMAPVVAANGTDTALVAWRSVLTGSTDKITTFESRDYIYYRIYKNGKWEETLPLYNGSAGAVKGLEAAMLEDGTAAVVYTLESDSSPVETYSQVDDETGAVSSNQEIYCAVIDAETASIREVRLTNDSNLDENPQVETVTMGKEQVFVVGWHSLQDADGVQKEDLLFRALDENGLVQENLVTSLSAAGGNDVELDSTFRFTKGAGTIDQLGVLWKGFQAADTLEQEDGETVASSQGRDIVQGLRFADGGSRITAAQPLATLEEGVQLDSFDARWEGDSLSLLLMGTDYNMGETKPVNGGETAVPLGMTNLYKESVSFSNRVEAGLPTTELATVKPGRTIDVEIPVTNRGTENITRLDFTFAGADSSTSIEETADLSQSPLAPGATRTVALQLDVDRVEDLTVTMTATFEGNSTAAGEWPQGNTLRLVYVDLNLRGVELLAAEKGLRAVRADLAVNSSLKTAEWQETYGTPVVRFYLDPECTVPLSSQTVSGRFTDPLFSSGDNGLFKQSQTVSHEEALDNGAYSVVQPLNLKGTISSLGDDAIRQLGLETDEAGELAAGGATIYAKVGFAQNGSAKDAGPSLEGDANEGNNVAALYLPSLLEQNSGQPVSARAETQKNQDGTLQVEALVQNTAFSKGRTINVTARFYSASGKLVETQTYYDKKAELLPLGPEEAKALTFTSASPDAERVELTCTEAVATENGNAGLADVKFQGAALPALNPGSFTFNEEKGKYTASIEVQDPVSTNLTVTATPSAAGAKASINGGGDRVQVAILPNGETVVTIVVTAPDGATKNTYEITIQSASTKPENPGNPSTPSPIYPPVIPDAEHGSVSVRPNRPHRGDTVTITATPEEGYRVGSVTVTDANGHKVGVTARDDGTYTFVQPGGKVTIHVTFLPEGWPFTDVGETQWFYGAVKYVYENAIMAGTAATLFEPNASVTRGQVVQMLYNLEGQPPAGGDSRFADVSPGDWWYSAVVWASENGVASGYGDGHFLPKQDISRQEFAQMLYNYALFKGYDLTAAGDLSQFPDGGDVAAWARQAMGWAHGNGLFTGHDNGSLEPKGTATRAQAASILMKFHREFMNR